VVVVVTWSAASALIVTETVVVPVAANWAYMAGHVRRATPNAIILFIFMGVLSRWRWL
jgi:hypothetical protein